MTQTKKEILDSQKIANQEALVHKLLSPDVKTIKRTIPGGKGMLAYLDKETMETAVYNWLRGCVAFTEVTISLAKEPEKFKPTVTKLVSFDTRLPDPEWMRDAEDGRRDLAKKLAGILNTRKLVYIKAQKDGIYIAEDKSNKFGPHVVLTEEMIAQNPEFVGKDVGTKVPSPDWEPYVEFVPVNRARYTNYAA